MAFVHSNANDIVNTPIINGKISHASSRKSIKISNNKTVLYTRLTKYLYKYKQKYCQITPSIQINNLNKLGKIPSVNQIGCLWRNLW